MKIKAVETPEGGYGLVIENPMGDVWITGPDDTLTQVTALLLERAFNDSEAWLASLQRTLTTDYPEPLADEIDEIRRTA